MNEWAYLTWFPEHGARLVHADDMSMLGSGIQGVVGEIEGNEGAWCVFRFEQRRVRVHSNLLTRCSAPAFRTGEAVRAVAPRTAVAGQIGSIRWHFKQHRAYFLLDGKRHSRYWADELERLT